MEPTKIKIVLVSEYFYPKNNGGTELYVYNLAKNLARLGNEIFIITCSDYQGKYVFDDLEIFVIPLNRNFDKKVITGQIPSDNLSYFVETIKKIKPNVVHFHTITPSINLFHFEKTKELGYPIIFTSHIPGHVCLRGDLLRDSQVCDGHVEEKKCLDCYHKSLGIPSPANLLTSFLIRKFHITFALTNAAKNKLDFFEKLNDYTNAIILVSQWQRSVFIKNDFDKENIYICRQAVETPETEIKKNKTSHFTIGFIGRVTLVKGLHLLLNAVKNINSEEINLKIVGIKQKDELKYFKKMKHMATSLNNCTWLDEVSNDQIPNFLSTIDILCIPSQWLETGPFVAYEAISNNVALLASNIGGLKEIIVEDKNGWFFQYDDTKSLEEKIKHLLNLYNLKGNLVTRQINLRSAKELADEMMTIYLNVQKQ